MIYLDLAVSIVKTMFALSILGQATLTAVLLIINSLKSKEDE
jgi:hypothetical protein